MGKFDAARNLNKSTSAYVKTPDQTDSKHHYALKSLNESSGKASAIGVIASTFALFGSWWYLKKFTN